MAKKSKRKNIRLPRRCIFCGGGNIRGNSMSKEHLWPEWMHPYLPKLPGAKKEDSYVRKTNKTIVQKYKKAQQGHAYTKTLKVVCKNCNETWMSQIEENAKPILIPLLQGLSFALNEIDNVKLATWFALKIMV